MSTISYQVPAPPALPALPTAPSVPALPTMAAPDAGYPAYASYPTYPGQPGYAPGYAPGYEPDVFDGMRDVTTGVARGLGNVGRAAGEALPAVGRTLADGTQVAGEALYQGGKQVAGALPAVGRGLWGGVSWIGEKLAAAGRWLFGGGRPDAYYPAYPAYPGYPAYPQPGFQMPWPPAVMVEKGDTLRQIAQAFLGDGERWRELYALNESQIRQAGGLRAGMVLVMPTPSNAPWPTEQPVKPVKPVNPTKPSQPTKPAPAAPVKPTPAPPAKRSYTVRDGDTLWDLAKRFYGDAERWDEIYDANKKQIADPNRIFPGQVLRIP